METRNGTQEWWKNAAGEREKEETVRNLTWQLHPHFLLHPCFTHVNVNALHPESDFLKVLYPLYISLHTFSIFMCVLLYYCRIFISSSIMCIDYIPEVWTISIQIIQNVEYL